MEPSDGVVLTPMAFCYAPLHITPSFYLPTKYRSEIQFLSCFIWHFVNPIETETGVEPEMEMGLFMLGCSLFCSRFEISQISVAGPIVKMLVSTT